jgi:cellulose synthase (UDP-forming)
VAYLISHDIVGLVQIPQTFRNPDILGVNLLVPWSITENQLAFMRVVEPSRDAWDAAFCIGSGFVVRRCAIDMMGGFPHETLADDVELTLALLAHGYATHFLNEKLSHGLSPQSIGEFVQQLTRWAVGSVEQLFHRNGPLRNPSMTLCQRVLFVELVVYWMTFITLALMLAAPTIYWSTGVPAIPNRHAAGMILFMSIRWLSRELAGYILTEGRTAPVIGLVSRVIACYPVATVVLLALLFGIKFPWHKKPDRIRTKPEINASAMAPAAYLCGLTALAFFVNLAGVGPVPRVDITAGNIFCSLASLVTLGVSVLACVDQPWDVKDDDADKEVQRFRPIAAMWGLIRRVIA